MVRIRRFNVVKTATVVALMYTVIVAVLTTLNLRIRTISSLPVPYSVRVWTGGTPRRVVPLR